MDLELLLGWELWSVGSLLIDCYLNRQGQMNDMLYLSYITIHIYRENKQESLCSSRNQFCITQEYMRCVFCLFNLNNALSLIHFCIDSVHVVDWQSQADFPPLYTQ